MVLAFRRGNRAMKGAGLRILTIRQIPECRRIQVPSFQPSWLRRLDSIAAFVFVREQEPQRENRAYLEEMADNHAPDTERVRRTLIGLVEERSRDLVVSFSTGICMDGGECDGDTGW